MADIFQEVDEDLRRDRYERLWQRYGGIILVVAIIVIAGTAGYVVWEKWRTTRQMTETQSLAEMIEPALAATGDAAAAATALAGFAGQSASGQAILARFFEAGLRAKAGDRPAAVAAYDRLAADSSLPAGYRDLAVLLAVLHNATDGDPAVLQARLAPLTAESGAWRHTARELTAVLAGRAGDTARARSLWQELAADGAAPASLRNRAAELAAQYGAS